jgi:hypothetical protein
MQTNFSCSLEHDPDEEGNITDEYQHASRSESRARLVLQSRLIKDHTVEEEDQDQLKKRTRSLSFGSRSLHGGRSGRQGRLNPSFLGVERKRRIKTNTNAYILCVTTPRTVTMHFRHHDSQSVRRFVD